MGELSAFVVAAPSTGAGKTTVSLGLMAALRARGMVVQGFKVGPDYIDPAYHAAVCGRASVNLDPWLTSEAFVRETFAHHVRDADVAVVEGVMGLFDGAGQGTGEGSTAHIAKLLGLPVVLVVDAYRASETLAAAALGCVAFDRTLDVCGVIAAQTAGDRQYASLRAAFERDDLPLLLGQVPSDEALRLPERQLGLVSVFEAPLTGEWRERIGAAISRGVDVEALLQRTLVKRPPTMESPEMNQRRVPIAVARDAVFCFYYEDNLRLLREAGAELVAFSPLDDRDVPADVGGIYFGGGFPESAAGRLAENGRMMERVRDFPGAIWAECGGLIYLCEGFVDAEGTDHRMVGRMPGTTAMTGRLAGFGYKEVKLARDTLLGATGEVVRGHEFHWSRWDREPAAAFDPFRCDGVTPGYCDGRTLASYLHVHLGGRRTMARGFVEAGRR